MKTKLKSIVAYALAFAFTLITGTSLAATPVAAWNGDFGTTQKGEYTLNANGNTVAADGSYIQISGAKGVSIAKTAGGDIGNQATTVIIRYTNYDTSSLGTDDAQVMIMNHVNSTADKDFIGMAATGEGKLWGIWQNAKWGTNKTGTGYGSVASDTKIFAFTWAQNGTAGAYCWMNGASKTGWSTLHGGRQIDSIWVGGPNESTTLAPATGMRIEAIAVFDSRLADADIAAYQAFPGDPILFNYRHDAADVTAGWKDCTQEGGNALNSQTSGGLTFSSTSIGGNFKGEFAGKVTSDFATDGAYVDINGDSHGTVSEEMAASLGIADVPASVYKSGVAQGANNNSTATIAGLDPSADYVVYIGCGHNNRGTNPQPNSIKINTDGLAGVEALDYVATVAFAGGDVGGTSSGTAIASVADKKYTSFNLGEQVAAGPQGLLVVRMTRATPKADGTIKFVLGGYFSSINFLAVKQLPPQPIPTATVTGNQTWGELEFSPAFTTGSKVNLTFAEGAQLTIDDDVSAGNITIVGTPKIAINDGKHLTCTALNGATSLELVSGAFTVPAANSLASVKIDENAVLTLDVSSAKTLNGIEGVGTFVKTGAAKLTLNNKHGAYAIDGTTLQIDNGEVLLNCGDGDAQAKNATFVIGANGSLTQYGWYNFYGTITFENATDKTVLGANVRANDGLTFVKRGAGKLTFTSGLGSGGNSDGIQGVTVEAGQIHFNNMAVLSPTTLTLDFSKFAADATPIDADFKVASNTSYNFPAGLAENAAFTLCSGTLSEAPTDPVRGASVRVNGETVKGAVLTYSGNMVSYAVPEDQKVDFSAKDAANIADIIAAVEEKESGWDGDVKVTVKPGMTFMVEQAIPYSNVALVSEGDLVVNYNATGDDAFGKLEFSEVKGVVTLKGTEKISGATLVAKDAQFSGEAVYEFDATATAFTANDTLKNMIKAAGGNRKFVFVGADEIGATLNFGNPGQSFATHIVFRGGKHAMTVTNVNRLFATGATGENPTVLVADGATLDFTAKDLSGWGQTVNMGAVVRVNDGATLNFIQDGANTFFYSQRLWIDPGALVTFAYDNAGNGESRFRWNGGVAENSEQIYVPASDTDQTAKPATIKKLGDGAFHLASDAPISMAAFVGKNSKLVFDTPITTGSANAVFKKTGDGEIEFKDSISITSADKFVVAGGKVTFNNDFANLALAGDAVIEVPADKQVTLIRAGDRAFTKLGAGTLTANTVVSGPAVTNIVNAGKFILNGFVDNAFSVGENGVVEFAMDVSEGGASEYKPTITKADGEIVIMLTISGDQVRNKTEFALATLATGLTKDDVTVKVFNADTGNEVDFESRVDEGVLKVNANVIAATHEFTPSASGSFTWTASGEFGEGIFKDYDNAIFNGSEFATEVTVGSKIEAGTVEIGGDYAFSGSPVIASSVNVKDGAKAAFSNNLVADALVVNDGSMSAENITASAVAITNANFEAAVMGPSMKYVRLTITATSDSSQKPAVGEFRLYRGNATTGYTIVDWPIGTKVSDSTGLKATKETANYPAEVGAGLGNYGGNECQPGCLIDGFYGSDNSTVTYGGGSYNTPHYNKWWPTASEVPCVVTIEFPYPVATFSGCNFCLADHEPRNPTAWTIEVSGDGTSWTTVNTTENATWSGQYAWAGGDETVPAFLNADTTPTVVTVGGDTTIVADGSWTADLKVSGNLTLKGVPEKYLTLDAASSSSFAQGAKLTFDLSAYSVTKAGKQYVVAGPLDGWPENIDVVPMGVFEVGKDDFGYFVEVLSGNCWLGDAQGVGVWDLGKSLAWGDTLGSAEPRIWLNGVAANFANSGVVTVEGTEIDPTAINFVGYNEVAVELKGTLDALEGKAINFQSTNDVLTINNENEFTPGAITEVDGANGKLVKKGAGTLTLSVDNTFTGGATIEAGTVKFGGTNGSGTKGPFGPYVANETTDWTVDAVVKGGATLDINGQPDMVYVFELEDGATFKNTGADIGTGQRQTRMLKLSGNATVEAVGVFGLHNGGNAQTKLELGEYTLTKTGTNAFELVNTAVSGAGTIDVREGILWANTSASTISNATLKIGADTTLKLNAALTTENLVLNGTIEGNAMLTVNGTLSGAGIIPNLTLGDGATADITAITVSNLTFGSSMTLVLNDTPTAVAPVKIVEGEFAEMSFFDTVVTVKVGDATLQGEYMITQNAEGMFVTESTVRRWTGKAEDSDWSNVENWNGGVPGEGNLAIVEVNGNMALTLPAGGVGTIPELRLVGAGTITLDATKLANVGTISVGNGVTFNVACDENVTLALAGTGNLVKQGTGTLTLAACDFATVTVEAGTLDFFVDEGDTLIAASVISGAGAVKKTGAGVLTLSGANTFEGGAEIVGGTLKAGVAGTATSSAVGTGTLKIGEGSTFDVGGAGYVFGANGAGYVIEAAGTLTNSGGIIYGDKNLIKSLTLTGDLTVTGSGLVIGVCGGNATPVVMNGHKITGATSGNFSIEKTTIAGGGEIEITSSELRTDGNETFDGKLILNGGNIEITTSNGAAMSVNDFEYKRGTFVDASKKLVVTGRVINGRADNKIQLADGATIYNDNGYAIQIGTNWGFDGVAYLDADESVVDGLVSLYKQGIDAALVYWSNAGNAFDPSVIKLSQHLKTELEKRGIALAKDEVNKCLKLTRALGFLIMLK